MNYHHWHGFTDGRFGYGSMLNGFLNHVPDRIRLDEMASVSVHMGVPFSCKGWYEGQHRVCFTMWETTVLPPKFVRWLNQYDQILVPCQHNVPVFAAHHPNVNYVPLGVDRTIWFPKKRKENKVFKFMAGGSLWERKGIDAVVTAFKRLDLPDAELHLKMAPHARDIPDDAHGDNIFFHRKWMTMGEQVDFFRSADCWVAPARGEGFGLIPLQAISAGVPTIVTASSGQAQFAHLASSIVKSSPQPCRWGGKWDEPNISDLVRLMRHHYENRVGLQVDAREKAVLADEFSWDNAANLLVDALPSGSKLDESSNCINPQVLLRAEVSKRTTVEVNGKAHRFEPGWVYEVDENIVDILYAGGYLKN